MENICTNAHTCKTTSSQRLKSVKYMIHLTLSAHAKNTLFVYTIYTHHRYNSNSNHTASSGRQSSSPRWSKSRSSIVVGTLPGSVPVVSRIEGVFFARVRKSLRNEDINRSMNSWNKNLLCSFCLWQHRSIVCSSVCNRTSIFHVYYIWTLNWVEILHVFPQ